MTPTCPTCGHDVRVVSADEGTSYYEPVEAPASLDEERLTRALFGRNIGHPFEETSDFNQTHYRQQAERVAAEYGALAPSEPEVEP